MAFTSALYPRGSHDLPPRLRVVLVVRYAEDRGVAREKDMSKSQMKRIKAMTDERDISGNWCCEHERELATLRNQPAPVAWIATNQHGDVLHFSKHDGWTVEVVIEERKT